MSERGRLIDGKAIAAEIRENIRIEVEKRAQQGRQPGLALILVGDDPASEVYVRMKKKACEKAGILSLIDKMPASSTQEEVLAKVEEINNDDRYHGLLVQSPLPKGLNEDEVVRAVNPAKDVDGFHPYNMGLLALGQPHFVPCTPLGVIELLKHSKLDPSGKDVVVIGRSHIVGMPMSLLLARKAEYANATVTICHSRTKDLKEKCAEADILIAAIGVPQFVTEDMVKDGAVVIDVGTNRIDAPGTKKGYKLVGDVDFENAKNKASWITPSPGGVGPMTIALLLQNTMLSEELLYQESQK